MRRTAHPRVGIKRGARDELLLLIDDSHVSLTQPETVPALKAAGSSAVRSLCEVLERGNTEARVEAAWLLGQIGATAAIPALTRTIEGARRSGEPPVLLRHATDALVHLGPAGVRAFAQASQLFAPEDLTRLLLIRQAAAQLVGNSPSLPLSRRTIRAWVRALRVYLGRLHELDRASKADPLNVDGIVLEAYGRSLDQERETVAKLIEALKRQPACA